MPTFGGHEAEYAISIYETLHMNTEMANRSTEKLIEIMKRTCALQGDIQSRSIFNTCLVSYFNLDPLAAKRLRRSLLLLCRLHDAVLVFAKAASVLPSFRALTVRVVRPSPGAATRMKAIDIRRTRDVLKDIGIHKTLAAATYSTYTNFGKKAGFESGKIFLESRRQICHVHAEIQVINDFETGMDDESWKVHRYIGSRELCCLLCELFLYSHQIFDHRGGHRGVYQRWAVPETFVARRIAQTFERCLQSIHYEIARCLIAVLRDGDDLARIDLRPESTIGLSSAATVPLDDNNEMNLRSEFSKRVPKGPGRVAFISDFIC